jgi:hypothetical protein
MYYYLRNEVNYFSNNYDDFNTIEFIIYVLLFKK